jgi:ATP-dependent RNA helicase DeaD
MTETSWDALRLSAEVRQSLAEMGYQAPTEVQQATLSKALAGHDLVVMSRTGTGKTAAFGVTIAEKLEPSLGQVQAVVLTPTRELALQVTDELAEIGKGRGLAVQVIYGGDSMEDQVRGIAAGAQIVVATPGRLLDHLKRRTLRLDEVRIFVLDEADKMLDMGFAQEMSEILNYVPEKRQTLLFSATIPLGIRGLIYHYLSDPQWVLLSEDFAYVKEVDHSYIITPRLQKDQVLYKLIEHDDPPSSMIFCNTRGEVRMVAHYLAHLGLPVAMISSDLPQRKREQVMERFRAGGIRHLVATDVAARGIDIEDLSHVFLYSTPDSPENYIHRAGRTGRIGKSGTAISLVSASDLVSFNRVVNRYHLKVHERSVPTDEEIRERKRQRILARLVAEAARAPAEELSALADVADAVATHEERARLLAYLLYKDFSGPVAGEELEQEEEEAARQPAAGERGGGPPREDRRPRRRRRRRRGGPQSAPTH